VDPIERLRPYVAGLAATWAQSTPDVRHRAIEGSLAFVDISGFTTLTERLAAKGKIGAEEMSDLLNSAFATLLEVAYGYGASLVKWGGDAVLLLYEGPEHAAQACRGAHEMQRTMRRIGRLRTSVGVVQLRMSVGISSGMFDFFLVGDRHRELLVAGPAATETAQMEQIAEAGEVVISAATVSRIPARCVGAAKDGGWLLHSAPPADPRSRWWPPTDIEVAGSCLDPAIRDHLLTEVGDSEHRQVAVGFVEVSGVDGLLERQGPGATAGALHDVIGLVQQACEHHRVTFWETDISKDGFKILLIGGAPRSSGQDEDAMLRAARAVLDGHDGPVRLRIGVNTGRVFNGGFGPPFRRTWSVKGDAVNLAARVMAKAETGQLLATEALLRRVASRVDADLLPAFMVKGKSEPVHAAVVQRVSAERVVETAGAFVGRRAEMDVLLDAARAAARGRGRGILVTGEAGVGKSRLVDHVVNRLDHSTTVLRGFGDDYESATPYYAVRRLLRAAIGQAVDAPDAAVAAQLRRSVRDRCPNLEPWLPLLAAPFDVDLPDSPETAAVQEEFRPARTHALVVQFLGTVLAGPTVYLVDDVQVVDDLSNELLTRMAAAASDQPWLLLLVGRAAPTTMQGDAAQHRLVVPPLSDDDAYALVIDSPAGQALAPHVIRSLVARGDGNPLFLHELTAAAADADGEELPSTLEELLAARIDDLAPAARQLLRSASVLGSRFDEALAAELLDEVPTAAQWAALDHFLASHTDGSRRFRTRLARDAAYEGLPFRRRVELHARAATAIEKRTAEDDDESEALSLHCLAAQRFADAFTYACRAGRQARSLYANADAAMFFARARAAARRAPELPADMVAAALEELADVHARLAELPAAVDAYRDARSRALIGPSIMRARTALGVALASARAGKTARAARWLALASRDLPPTAGESVDPDVVSLHGRITLERAVLRSWQGRHREAAALAEEALAYADKHGNTEGVGRALQFLDYNDLVTGRAGDVARAQRALAIFEQRGDLGREAAMWNQFGVHAYYAGDWNTAVERYAKAAELHTRIGDDWNATTNSANIAEILVDQGRLTEAEPLAADALRVWRVSGTPWDVGFAAVLLARLLGRSGRPDEAVALLEEAAAGYAGSNDRMGAVDADIQAVEVLVLAGRTAAAAVRLDTVESALRQLLAGTSAGPLHQARQAPELLRLRGYVAGQQGGDAAAAEHLRAGLEIARGQGAPLPVARVLDALAWLAPQDVSVAAERDEIFARLGVVWSPAVPRRALQPVEVALPHQRSVDVEVRIARRH
jgi:class 3 adenylate cyclase/tetratricopeptide (TPR) repeat protein